MWQRSIGECVEEHEGEEEGVSCEREYERANYEKLYRKPFQSRGVLLVLVGLIEGGWRDEGRRDAWIDL